jgi:hypothetical protein
MPSKPPLRRRLHRQQQRRPVRARGGYLQSNINAMALAETAAPTKLSFVSATQAVFTCFSSPFAVFVFPSDYAAPFSAFPFCLYLYFPYHPFLLLLD